MWLFSLLYVVAGSVVLSTAMFLLASMRVEMIACTRDTHLFVFALLRETDHA